MVGSLNLLPRKTVHHSKPQFFLSDIYHASHLYQHCMLRFYSEVITFLVIQKAQLLSLGALQPDRRPQISEMS